MSVIEDVGPIGVRPAERRPVRALALAVLSRVMIVVLLVTVAWAAIAVRSVIAVGRIEERPLTVVERPAVEPAGTSVGAMLEDVRARIAREGASLVDVEVTRRSGAAASVRLTTELPRSGASAVDRLIASLARGELTDPTPRSVDPVPSGLRVSIDASIELASAPPAVTAPDGRAAAIVLADAAERADVELRSVEVPDRPQDPVRLATTGDLADLVRLVEMVEREHSAPPRFRGVSVRRTTSGAHDMVLSFVLSEDAIGTAEAR